MRIQITNSEYPNNQLWLELPITNDPNWIRTTGKLARLMAPDQEEATLSVTDVDSVIPNLKKYILQDKDEVSINNWNALSQKLSCMSLVDMRKLTCILDIVRHSHIIGHSIVFAT